MAADQRKKRLNPAIIPSSRGQGRVKKKKLGLLQCDLSMRSSISLTWDDTKKSVISKPEQIGLTRRDLIPFIGYVPLCHNILADVLSVPNEIFELDNLKDVLSYEVWQTHLSKDERDYLTEFLPKGAEGRQVVQELLVGDNFHFGNPFLKWGASLCSGNLHPDAVIHQEQCFKTSKKSYYSKLQKYHNGMIGNLLMWKERWGSCKDLEEEIVHKIWRFRKQAGRSISFAANETRYHDAEEDLAVTSESGSWNAEEKAVSSEDQSLMRKHGEQQKRKGFMEDPYDDLLSGIKVLERPIKGEKLRKQNIQCGDGSKYMSYIKVSREQHQRVKSSIKNSSSTVLSRSLNRVLGNLDDFQIRPFKAFEEEEQQKLHQHWLQLATRDLPVTFANWKTWKTKKQKLAQSLEQEMVEKLLLFKEGEVKENAYTLLPGPTDDTAANSEAKITVEVEERGNSDSLLQEQRDGGAENRKFAMASGDKQREKPDQEITDNEAAIHEPAIEDEFESLHVSTHNHDLQSIPSLSRSHVFVPMNLDPDNHSDNSANLSEYPENLSRANIDVTRGVPLSSTSDVWPAVSMPDSFYHSTSLNHDYASARELSLGHLHVFEEQQGRLIDLESDNREEDTVKDLLLRQPNGIPFFNPYTDQEVQNRAELLQRLVKDQEGLRPHHEQKQKQLDFLPASNLSMETGQFSGQFGEQLRTSLPLEPMQKRLNDVYIHQNIPEKMFCDGGRFSFPSQEHLAPLPHVQDWAVSANHMPVPLPSHLDVGGLGRNWFSGEHRARGGWSGLDAVGPTQSNGNKSSADQSLLGVLFQHTNELHPGVPYDSLGSNERFIQSGTYGGAGALFPTVTNVLPNPAHPLNYYSGRETAAPLKNNDMGWMSTPHQNSALQDSIGEPFLRSWTK